MNSTQLLKFAGAVLAFGAWLALVIVGKAPADHLIDALALTITGLGVHGATMSTPTVAVAGPASSVELQPAAAFFAPAAAVSTTASTPAPAAAPTPATASATLQ